MITAGSEPRLRVLVFGASLRADSLNRKLAALAARVAEQHGATVDHASMRDFDVPSYDGDAESARGMPEGAAALRRRLLESDAFILSLPQAHKALVGGDIAETALQARFEPPDAEADRVDPVPT